MRSLLQNSSLQLVAALALIATCSAAPHLSQRSDNWTSPIIWVSCGTGFDTLDCATVVVPMDWNDTTVPGNFSLALTRLKATNTPYLGSLLVNPGGPAVSGTAEIYELGADFSALVNGQYDIVGWDPRGVNLTTPGVNCFPNALDDYLFSLGGVANSGTLDLPHDLSHSSTQIQGDLLGQIRRKRSSYAALGQLCAEGTPALPYVGTVQVIHDIDYLSQQLDGPNSVINYYGISYGTILGQYMVKLLPPSRIGRFALDGVGGVTTWAGYSDGRSTRPSDVEKVVEAFAKFCAEGGPNCALSYLNTSTAILSAVYGLIDDLYTSPASTPADPNAPGGIVTAEYARALLFQGMYQLSTWPYVAEAFAAALQSSNYSLLLVDAPQLPVTLTQAADLSDSELYAVWAIACADSKPFDSKHPAPSSADWAKQIWNELKKESAVSGEAFYYLSWCDLLPPSKSWYDGPFTLEKNTLKTPVLILTNTLDPSPPLVGAVDAFHNMGVTNSRLVEQNGTIHTTIAQRSPCTQAIVVSYFVNGTLPSQEHTHCIVEDLPFQS